jgi:hypothetical protein
LEPFYQEVLKHRQELLLSGCGGIFRFCIDGEPFGSCDDPIFSTFDEPHASQAKSDA